MTCSDGLYPPPSPQSAAYLVRYTLVYISTAVFYGEGFICYSPSRKSKSNSTFIARENDNPYEEVRTPYGLFS